MPVDYPDFGVPETSTAYPLMGDLGELAVRLGSIVIFDRRGRVIDLDDFESPLIRWATSTPGNSTITLDGTNAKTGAQSLRLFTSPTTGQVAYIGRGFRPLPTKRVGIEIAFSQISTSGYFYLRLISYNATDGYQGWIKIDPNAKKIYYYDDTPAWHELADIDQFSTAVHIYYPVKLVVDFDTNKYVRLILGDTEYDLSSYNLPTIGHDGAVYLYTMFQLELRSGVSTNIYLDDYIMTKDEP